MAVFEVAVGVPSSRAAIRPMEHLHESDTPFDEPASNDELPAHGLCFFLAEAVKLLRGRRLARQIDVFRTGPLHLKGQFVRLDAGGECGIVWILDPSELV